jgi:hypothetical protein
VRRGMTTWSPGGFRPRAQFSPCDLGRHFLASPPLLVLPRIIFFIVLTLATGTDMAENLYAQALLNIIWSRQTATATELQRIADALATGNDSMYLVWIPCWS